MRKETESEFIGHEPCPKCGSRDNLARYDDGHGWCFGCGYYENDNEIVEGGSMEFVNGECIELTKRGITKETTEKWGYQVGSHMGKSVQVANYRDTKGNIVLKKPIEVKNGINMYILDEEISSGIYYINIMNGATTTKIVKHSIL